MIPVIERRLIDGVTVLRADSPTGQSAAALIFRVGRFDETLPASGITHLAEHLVFSGKDRPSYHYNAMVTGRHTSFHMASAASSDIADFVATVCGGLAADHSERLEMERRVLRTEAASRGGTGALGSCLIERFGAVGPGVAGYEELGLRAVTMEQVAAWRRRWFTARNAVLVVLGEIPAGLRVDLPDGGPPPELIAPRTFAARLPGFAVVQQPGLGLSMVSPGSLAATTALQVLQQRLTDKLRHERGLSYGVAAAVDDIDSKLRHVWLAADALPENGPAAAHVMLDTFEQFADEGSKPEELAGYCRQVTEAYQSPAGPMMIMRRQAEQILFGQPVRQPEEVLTGLAALAGAEIATAARELFDSMIVTTRGVIPAVQGRMPQLPLWSAAPVEGGISYRSRDPGSAQSLTISSSGVMLTIKPGQFVSVPAGEVAALLQWNDAKLTLVGSDGFAVQIDQARWLGADEAITRLVSGIDRGLTVTMDAPGPASSEPAPPAAATARPAAPPVRLAPQPSWLAPLVLIGVAVLIAAALATVAVLKPHLTSQEFGPILPAAVVGIIIALNVVVRRRGR